MAHKCATLHLLTGTYVPPGAIATMAQWCYIPAMPAPSKMTEQHHAIIEWLLDNPDRNYGDMCLELNISRSWLSIVMNSDLFKEHLSRRRTERNALTDARLAEQRTTLASRAMTRLGEKLTADELRPDVLLGIAKLGGEPGGSSGDKNGLGPQPQFIPVIGVTPEMLAHARQLYHESAARSARDAAQRLGLTIDADSATP